MIVNRSKNDELPNWLIASKNLRKPPYTPSKISQSRAIPFSIPCDWSRTYTVAPVRREPPGSCPANSCPWWSCSSAAAPARNHLCRWCWWRCSVGCTSCSFGCCPTNCASRVRCCVSFAIKTKSHSSRNGARLGQWSQLEKFINMYLCELFRGSRSVSSPHFWEAKYQLRSHTECEAFEHIR